MSEHYEPPFTMTGEITGLIVEICELVGSISTYEAMNPNPVFSLSANMLANSLGIT